MGDGELGQSRFLNLLNSLDSQRRLSCALRKCCTQAIEMSVAKEISNRSNAIFVGQVDISVD